MYDHFGYDALPDAYPERCQRGRMAGPSVAHLSGIIKTIFKLADQNI
jgi:hypothetical protein